MSSKTGYKDISYKWLNWRNRVKVVDDLMLGQKTVQEKAGIYLTRGPAEDIDSFNYRVSKSTFNNGYQDTIRRSASKVFSRPVHLKGGHPVLQTLMHDMDGQGNDVNCVAKNLFEAGINHGLSYLIIDHPKMETSMSLQNRLKNNIRPQWKVVKASQVLNDKWAVINNVRQLVCFEYEMIKSDDLLEVDFQYSDHTAQTVADRMVCKYEMQVVDGEYTGKVLHSIQMCDEDYNMVGYTAPVELDGFPRIPIVTYYTNKTEGDCGLPPLEELAWKCIEHYNVNSDYHFNMHMSSVCMLQLKGWRSQTKEGKPNQFKISPNTAYEFTVDGGMEWVSGDADTHGANLARTNHVLDEMRLLSMEPFINASGSDMATATGRVIDEAEATSMLRAWALALESTLNTALAWTLTLMPDLPQGEEPARLGVNQAFVNIYETDTTVRMLWDLYREGMLSAQQFFDEIKKLDLISKDIALSRDPDYVITGNDTALIDNWQKMLDMGIVSPVDFHVKVMGLTREQAVAEVKRIQKDNEMLTGFDRDINPEDVVEGDDIDDSMTVQDEAE